ncbi:uncharacterized protein EV420DRAFT_1689874 [Desarmillaria tabescens]|uniref:DUF6534 domain-containing protein n=1 Tax=Armillaria tabescens TaxID=1929756 RepID=A0AA39N4S7_ARMTA|nr:uncharacterized protein EV420DRAFT_1689874 [Desarmillaria tabescens]KAK0457265.1 hypothetical protein EV420DRAFT_1689874 [Desarmillaria tabescens]
MLIARSSFYGITILQTVVYYKQYPNDPRIFRYSVAVLWALDTLQVALNTHALYYYMVESFGNYAALLEIVWYVHLASAVALGLPKVTGRSFPLLLTINMLIVVGVQAYISFNWFSIEKTHSSILQLIRGQNMETWSTFPCSVALVHYLNRVWNPPSFLLSQHPSAPESLRTASGTDFFIAAAMCYYLHRGTSMTSFSSTTKIIAGLMRLVVISGLATSTCSLLTLVTFVAWPKTLIFIAVHSILPKLYINSLLAMQVYLPLIWTTS